MYFLDLLETVFRIVWPLVLIGCLAIYFLRYEKPPLPEDKREVER